MVLHAVTDALLGAAGLGDIGDAFPDTDPQWKDADSRLFLARDAGAAEPARAGGVVNVDVTSSPRSRSSARSRPRSATTSPRCSACRADAVNVKAKTGEHVGHIGRGEAIGCQAVVLIESRTDH